MNRDDALHIRDEIIRAVLPHVVFDGWSWPSVCRAAVDAGHSEAVARAVFPARMADVMDGFADLADREMLDKLAGMDAGAMRVRDRIRAALLARYAFLAPHREALRQSVQYWAVPTRKLRGGKVVWRTADRIWNWAGDEARDYNHYTKRALLSGIIVSSALYWLNSTEEDAGGLESFIDRRIENVMQFGKIMSRVRRAS